MQTLAEIKAILDRAGLRPKKSLGQNFLVDQNLLRKLVDASGTERGETILEVGPGTGTLTEELLARGCRVIACELDDELARLLPERAERIGAADRLDVVHADCIAGKRSLHPLLQERVDASEFRLVANLPYGAATPLLLTLLTRHPRCRSMTVTVQREVADRLEAGSRSRDYGTISVIVAAVARAERIATLPPSCFWPQPDVTSAMIHIERRTDPLTDDPAGLADFCQVLFRSRRKQVGASMGRDRLPDWLEPTLRPEALDPGEIARFHRHIAGK